MTDTDEVILTGFGRSAMLLGLRALRKKGYDRVLIPAFTCEVLPLAVLEAGFQLKFVDIDEDLNPLFDGVSNSDIMLLIHYFGSLQETFLEKLPDRGLVIEDLSHSLGAIGRTGRLGSTSRMCFGSLYKVIPNVGSGFLAYKEELGLSYIQECQVLNIIHEIVKSFIGFMSTLEMFASCSPSALFIYRMLVNTTEASTNIPRLRKSYLSDRGLTFSTISRLGLILSSAGLSIYELIVERRRRMSDLLRIKLSKRQKLYFPNLSSYRHSVATYFPILIKNNEIKRKFLTAATMSGLFFFHMWPKTASMLKDAGIYSKYPFSRLAYESLVAIRINPFSDINRFEQKVDRLDRNLDNLGVE
jgi:dTDP-4-amino-4,6-dideoxygalactose transaminase